MSSGRRKWTRAAFSKSVWQKYLEILRMGSCISSCHYYAIALVHILRIQQEHTRGYEIFWIQRNLHSVDLFNTLPVRTIDDIASELFFQVVQSVQDTICVFPFHQCRKSVLWFLVLHERNDRHPLCSDLLHYDDVCVWVGRIDRQTF